MQKVVKHTNFNINYQEDGVGFEEQLQNGYIVQKGFFVAKEQLLLKSEKVNDFIKDISENFKEVKKFNFPISKYEHNIVLESPDFFIYIVKDVTKSGDKKDSAFIYTKNYEILEKLIKIYKLYAAEWDSEVKVSFTKYSYNNGQIITEKNYKYLKNYEDIKREYYPFINIDLFIKEFLESHENILILTGKPGVGKSKFPSLIIKEMLKNPEYIDKLNQQEEEIFFEDDDKVLYVGYSKNIKMLAMDIFWSKINYENLIIFDDLDFILSDRNENREDELKNQFLSHLLSFTDGIEKNKVKIIITTNQDYKDIDEALLRKGRLFDILQFRGLTEEEALNVWKSYGLEDKLFYETLPELRKKDDEYILQSDLASTIENLQRNKKLIKKEDYILDKSIRVLKKDNRNKKVGFGI